MARLFFMRAWGCPRVPHVALPGAPARIPCASAARRLVPGMRPRPACAATRGPSAGRRCRLHPAVFERVHLPRGHVRAPAGGAACILRGRTGDMMPSMSGRSSRRHAAGWRPGAGRAGKPGRRRPVAARAGRGGDVRAGRRPVIRLEHPGRACAQRIGSGSAAKGRQGMRQGRPHSIRHACPHMTRGPGRRRGRRERRERDVRHGLCGRRYGDGVPPARRHGRVRIESAGGGDMVIHTRHLARFDTAASERDMPPTALRMCSLRLGCADLVQIRPCGCSDAAEQPEADSGMRPLDRVGLDAAPWDMGHPRSGRALTPRRCLSRSP